MNLKAEIVRVIGTLGKKYSTPPVRYLISSDLFFARLSAVTTFHSCLKQLLKDSCWS